MDREPLLEVKGSSLFGAGQKRLRVFEEGVEAEQSRWPARPSTETMRHEQVASVGTNAAPFLHVDLIVESRGGARIVVKNLSRRDANAAKELLEGLAGAGPSGGGSAPAGAYPDVADQIRKLAELRDAGILTEEEFAEKKADLLRRM